MPSDTSRVPYTDLARKDWRRLHEGGSRTPDGAPAGLVARNSWLERIKARQEEKMQQRSSLKSKQSSSGAASRTSGGGGAGQGPGTRAGSEGGGGGGGLFTASPSGGTAATSSLNGARQRKAQGSLEAVEQQQGLQEAEQPLDVPLPGPEPVDVRVGVRPHSRLWTAMGGGIAVVLNPYSPAPDGGEQLQHTSCVTETASSSDGRHLITGDVSGQAILWDVTEGKALHAMRLPEGGLEGICKLDWNSQQDLVVCSAGKGKAVVWDVLTGQVRHELIGHNTFGVVRSCKFSPDGKLIASGGDFGIVIIWDTASGKPVKQLDGHSDHVNTCSWSPDSRRLASGSADGVLAVSDVRPDATECILASSPGGDMEGITCVRWNPMGHSIAAAGRDARIVIHDPNKRGVLHTLIGHLAPVTTCSWCSDGTQLASCGQDHKVFVWDCKGGAALHVLVGHALDTSCVSWHASGGKLVSSGLDGRIIVWDTQTGTVLQELESQQEKALTLHSNSSREGILVATFSPDGSTIVAAGGGGEVIIWDSQPDMQQRVLDCADNAICRIAWSPDGSKAACGCESGAVVVWHVGERRELHRLRGHSDAVSSCDFDSGGRWLASAGADGLLLVWDVGSGSRLQSLEGHRGPISMCQWCPQGSRLASAGADGIVHVWDAATGAAAFKLRRHRGAVPHCSWSPNGRLLASCGWYDRSVVLWNAETGAVLKTLSGHSGAVTVCMWSPDGRKVVSGGARGEAVVWDALSGSKMAVLKGDHDAPEGCSFSPDGSMILCYDSQQIHVWAAAVPAEAPAARASGRWDMLLQLRGHHDALTACEWSPDSRHILSCGRDRRVVVWQVATGEAVYHLDGHLAGVGYARWSPDGTEVASGDEASRLLLWRWLPRYSYMAAPGPMLFYFRVRLMQAAFQRELADATATAHPSVLTAQTAEGATLLHIAARHTDMELLAWMLAFSTQHAFPLAMSRDAAGHSPLDYAIHNQWWQGMSRLVGAIHGGVVQLSLELQSSLFTTQAFKILLRHFASELEPLLQEGSACGVTVVSSGFTVSDTSGILLKLGQEGTGMVVAGSNHRLIPAEQLQPFWQRALQARTQQKHASFGLPPKEQRQQMDATAVVSLQRVGWADCAAQAPRGVLHSLLRSEVSAHMYGLPVVRAVIDLKWWSFARAYMMRELALYTLLLAMFTAYALALSEDGRAAKRSWRVFHAVFVPSMAVSVLALVARFLMHELRQMRMYGRQHWASFWNCMNAIAYSLFLPVLLMHAAGYKDAGAFKVVLAADAVLLWANLLHFAKAFRGTGALVQMVTMTVSDMRWFVLLLFVVMFGFGTSFLVLFSGPQPRSPEFADVDNALLSMFLFMLGSFNMEAFDLAAVPAAAVLLFVFYEVVVTVVLLNLLIAIMGESFSKVVASEEQQFLKGRAELIDEVEVAVLRHGTAAANAGAWFPRYLHILRPGQQSAAAGDASEAKVEAALAKTEEAVARALARLQEAVAGAQEQLPSVVQDAVAAQLDRFLEQPIASLLKAAGSASPLGSPPLEARAGGPAPAPGSPPRPAKRLEALRSKRYSFREGWEGCNGLH